MIVPERLGVRKARRCDLVRVQREQRGAIGVCTVPGVRAARGPGKVPKGSWCGSRREAVVRVLGRRAAGADRGPNRRPSDWDAARVDDGRMEPAEKVDAAAGRCGPVCGLPVRHRGRVLGSVDRHVVQVRVRGSVDPELVVLAYDVREVHTDVRVIRVQIARRGQAEIAGAAAGVLVDSLYPRAVQARARRPPRHEGRVIVVICVDPEVRNLIIREARDLGIRDVEGRARRIEPSGELQHGAIFHREPTVGPGDSESEFQERRDGIRLGRDSRVVEDEFSARVHIERVGLMGGVLGEAQAAVDQREASTRIDVDRRVDRVQDVGADLRRGDRPRLGDDAPDLIASARAGSGAQRKDGREGSTENQRPNDHGAQGLMARVDPARHRTTSPIDPPPYPRRARTGGHVARPSGTDS